MLACFFLLLTTLQLALTFESGLFAAQRGDAILHRRQARFAFITLGQQALQFLPTRQHAGFRLAGATHPQKMPADPIAIRADQTLALRQRRALGQCAFQRLDRSHVAQPWRKIKRRLDPLQQAAQAAVTAARRADQIQCALLEACKLDLGEIVQQHRL